ncbi:CLUMA_CG017668, isoform A [Clunio marinus]|uniref:CLUMA_CG017668, isoform A n=1 Tax=Clunio marinus TaxID=568069 RepID=A0A1J1IWX1_9DIPT|nr:CLUMA_CG017668, isoform A [Clunio marinus]
MSTNYVHKLCPQTMSTKYVHKICPQTMSTKYVHKLCPQTMSTNNVHKLCPQTMSTYIDRVEIVKVKRTEAKVTRFRLLFIRSKTGSKKTHTRLLKQSGGNRHLWQMTMTTLSNSSGNCSNIEWEIPLIT